MWFRNDLRLADNPALTFATINHDDVHVQVWAVDVADWSAFGLPEGSRIRVGLHAGPVFRGFDPVIGRDNFFGASVTRTPPSLPNTSCAPRAMLFASCSTPPWQLRSCARSRRAYLSWIC